MITNTVQTESNVISIFVDIRGFTEWSENQNVYSKIDIFIDDFYKILNDTFSGCSIKNLGDGAMITQEFSSEYSPTMITNIIEKIDKVTTAFSKTCTSFEEKHGQKTNLCLGWGITRGTVKKINNDYLGSTINKASRLCGFARPFGIVLDKYNFKTVDKDRFFEETYSIKGIEKPVECLVTKEIKTSFVPREI